MKIKARPKLDLVFKKIFGNSSNSDILIDFLAAVFDISTSDIIDVTILDNEIIPDALDKKFSRLDLLLHTIKGYINIEIQVNNYGDFKERAVFYWAKVFSKQLDKGIKYAELQPTISINIVDFILFPEYEKSHSTFELIERNEHIKLTDALRIDFLELPKARRNKMNNKLQEWLDFLNVETEDELNTLENNTDNNAVKKAIAVVHKMSADERELYEIEKREEAIREEQFAINFAKKQGREEGIQQGREEGMQQGIQQGREEGIQQGMQQGEIKGKIIGKVESAFAMIKNGADKVSTLKMLELDEDTFNTVVAENNLE